MRNRSRLGDMPTPPKDGIELVGKRGGQRGECQSHFVRSDRRRCTFRPCLQTLLARRGWNEEMQIVQTSLEGEKDKIKLEVLMALLLGRCMDCVARKRAREAYLT